MKVDDLFFLVFNSNWAGVFVKLKLKPPFKNPGSATVTVFSQQRFTLDQCSVLLATVQVNLQTAN